MWHNLKTQINNSLLSSSRNLLRVSLPAICCFFSYFLSSSFSIFPSEHAAFSSSVTFPLSIVVPLCCLHTQTHTASRVLGLPCFQLSSTTGCCSAGHGIWLLSLLECSYQRTSHMSARFGAKSLNSGLS